MVSTLDKASFAINVSNQGVSYTSGNSSGFSASLGVASAFASVVKLPITSGYTGLAQVYWNYESNGGNIGKLTGGDIITLMGVATLGLNPWFGVGLAIAGLTYSIYESKYGSVTVGDIEDYWFGKEKEIQNTFDKLAEKSKKDQENGTHTPITPDELEKLLRPIFREPLDLSDEEWAELTKPLYLDTDTERFFDTKQWEADIAWFEDNFGSWKNLDRQGNYYIYDPLILDLDGDGIETVGIDFKTAGNNAYFDFDNDGLLNATGWVKSDDGLLVRDLNNDGLINNGSEIFGDRTLKQNGELATHGFDALADLDDNKDGIINHQDSAFDTLKVWQDYNKDGISQADELKSLSDLNIQSFRLLRACRFYNSIHS